MTGQGLPVTPLTHATEARAQRSQFRPARNKTKCKELFSSTDTLLLFFFFSIRIFATVRIAYAGGRPVGQVQLRHLPPRLQVSFFFQIPRY